jgi:hypothetical protein
MATEFAAMLLLWIVLVLRLLLGTEVTQIAEELDLTPRVVPGSMLDP